MPTRPRLGWQSGEIWLGGPAVLIDGQIAVGEDTLYTTQGRENTAVRFEKPETRSQFIDSNMRPIGDKARIAANAPLKCGRPLVSWLHGLSLLPSFVDSRFTSFVVVSWDSAFVWAQIYPEPQFGLEFGVGWISGSLRHPARARAHEGCKVNIFSTKIQQSMGCF